MRKLISVLSLCSLLLFAVACSGREEEDHIVPLPENKVDLTALSGQCVQPGQLIVKFKQEPADVVTRASDVRIRKMERVFPHAGKFEERSRAAELHLWYVVEYDESISITRAAETLSLLDDVLTIEPVIPVVRSGRGTLKRLSDSDAVLLKKTSTRSSFTDPYLYAQWNFENTGNVSHSREGADIRLFDAWEYSTGHPDVIVAVVDGGVDYAHEDLAANMWINTAEQRGADNTDDDGNGYKDDIYGYNFVTGKAIEPTLHGTHVAGIIGAVNNNDIGVSGIAGGDGSAGSGVRLMNCQIFLDNAQGERSATNYYTAAAIKYGADNGAVICQNSWGIELGTVTSTPQVIRDAINYFKANAGIDEHGNQVGPMRGGLVVFAAGNDDVATPTFPTSDSNVISVGAMAADYKKATYSNYGSDITIMAPGGDIAFDAKKGRTGILSLGGGWNGEQTVTNAYYYMDGTSMACPHVSGVAALLVSAYGVGRPGLTPTRVKEIIYGSTYDISAYNAEYSGMLGVGALDAAGSFGYVSTNPVAPVLLQSFPNLTFTRTGSSQTFVLSNYFASAESNAKLAYQVAVTTSAISVELVDGQLTVSGRAYGKADVTVTATSASGLETTTTFLASCYAKDIDQNRDRPGYWSGVSDPQP